MTAFQHFGACKGRRALTTGGPEFVGSNLARKFVETGGLEVTTLDAR